MREYELIFIVHPDLDESAFNEVVERVSGWITDEDGKIDKTEIWGKRALAYPIQKQSEGQYVLLHTTLHPQSGATLERSLRYLEPVMRFLLVAK
jgi:small subunit ribosomal protein S6